eukprot:4612800-Karenia_brevis.AAC.1
MCPHQGKIRGAYCVQAGSWLQPLLESIAGHVETGAQDALSLAMAPSSQVQLGMYQYTPKNRPY